MKLSFYFESDVQIVAVLVNWNGKSFLESSISSVLSELSSYNGKLLLVDNASTDGSIDMVQRDFPEVAILRNSKNLGGSGGFSAGIKVAIEQTDCEYVWLLDNDIVVEPSALEPLLTCLRGDSCVGAAGSQICLYNKPDTIQEVGAKVSPWLGALIPIFSGQRRLPSTTPAFVVDYLPACSLLIKRPCLENVGLFADFFISYDDVEWGLRAKQAGWLLKAVPASVIRHQYNAVKPIVPWREYYKKRNRLALLAVYPPLYGGIFVSVVYIYYLNYLILFTKYNSYYAFCRAYSSALYDGINFRLGYMEISDDCRGCENECFACLNSVSSILLDIGEGAGDAVALIQAVRNYYPNMIFYLPLDRSAQYKLIQTENVLLSSCAESSIIIIGKLYRIRPRLLTYTIYQFVDGNLKFVSKLDLFKRVIISLLSLVLAGLRTPVFWILQLWNYRRISGFNGHSE